MTTSLLRPYALATLLGLTFMGQASAAPYTTLDAQASNITFGYSQMNVKMDGSFSAIKANDFSFDPAQPEAAKVAIEVALASVDAGYDEANTELRKDEWLAMSAHPLATFTSSRVTALGEQRYQIDGELSIKGVTQAVSAPVSFKEQDGKGIFEGGFTFQRADFGIGEGQWKNFGIVANDIQISFQIVAQP